MKISKTQFGGKKAILPLNNKYINIMESKENYIAEIQNELNQISMFGSFK